MQNLFLSSDGYCAIKLVENLIKIWRLKRSIEIKQKGMEERMQIFTFEKSLN